MSGGRKKKSKATKVAQATPKYVVSPASPVKTRSSTSQSGKVGKKSDLPLVGAVAAATPPPQSAVLDSPESVSSVIRDSISAIEQKLDNRFDKMETALRASLTNSVTASAPVKPAKTSVKPVAVSDVLPSIAEDIEGDGHSSRSSSASSASDYRSSSSSSRSRSPSSSRSSRRHRRHRHRRSKRSSSRRSRSYSKSRSRSRRHKHSKYSNARYLRENQKCTTYERLVLVNTRMALALYKREKDIAGVLKHIILIAEKADKDVFEAEALINYDESVKDSAKEDGIKAFSKLDPANIVKHLSYDGTHQAKNGKGAAAAAKRPASAARKSGARKGACLKHNFDPSGCSRGRDCYYKHACSACGAFGHINDGCPNVKLQTK